MYQCRQRPVVEDEVEVARTFIRYEDSSNSHVRSSSISSSSSTHRRAGKTARQNSNPGTDLQVKNITRARQRQGATSSERGKIFRAKQKKCYDDLVTSVESLRTEVDQLCKVLYSSERQLQQNTPIDNLDRAISHVREYFRLFQYGVPAYTSELHSEEQIDFLHYAISSSVRSNVAIGVEEILEQWRRYSAWHEDFQMHPVYLEEQILQYNHHEDEPIILIHVPARIQVRFTQQTLEQIFPGAFKYKDLMEQLIGQEVCYHSVQEFHFNAQNLIVGLYVHNDFVLALWERLQNIHAVNYLMETSTIQSNWIIGY